MNMLCADAGEPARADARGLEREHALAAAINAVSGINPCPLTYNDQGLLEGKKW